MLDNIILQTDSYKLTHWKMYPPYTTLIHSYFEARKGARFKHTTFFGLQYYIKRYLTGVRVTAEGLSAARLFSLKHFGQDLLNVEGWQHIIDVHNGHLPVKIYAVAEGSAHLENTPLFTIENTDPKCYWLTNHLETLLVQVWYASTVATLSRYCKAMLKTYLEMTADNTEGLPFKLHDFGYRGVSSSESAAVGGAAHLVNFQGSDTLAACELLMEYYGSDMPAFSVPAAEHSTITSWGESREIEAYDNILTAYPHGIVSVVSDSYDLDYACTKLWLSLKDKISRRKGALVIRPDSGDPASTVIRTLNNLGNGFGYKTNSKGYKVLPSYLKVIQGDGITFESLEHILHEIAKSKWSTDNMVFGSGGGLLQSCNRDTQRFALKCSYAEIMGQPRDVWKNPKTDPSKKSMAGRQTSVQMAKVFEDGKLMYVNTLENIRSLANTTLLGE